MQVGLGELARLDLRPALPEVDIITVKTLLKSVEAMDSGAGMMELPLNQQFKAAGGRPLALETLAELRECVIRAGGGKITRGAVLSFARSFPVPIGILQANENGTRSNDSAGLV